MAMFNSYVKLPEGIWIYQPTQAKSMSFFFQIFPETNSGININKKDLQLMMPTRIILNCLITITNLWFGGWNNENPLANLRIKDHRNTIGWLDTDHISHVSSWCHFLLTSPKWSRCFPWKVPPYLPTWIPVDLERIIKLTVICPGLMVNPDCPDSYSGALRRYHPEVIN